MMPPYMSVKVRQTTIPGTTCPTFYEEEKSPTDLLPVQGLVRRGLQFIVLIREDQKVQPFADVITKAAISPQLFKDPESWSGRGLNLRPPAQQTGAYPIELTGRGSPQITLKKVLGRSFITFNTLHTIVI